MAPWTWTGSNPDGTPGDGFQYLGTVLAGARIGWRDKTSSAWIYVATDTPSYARNGLYAISSELTDDVPEPTTIGLTALGGAILLLATRRKRKGQ
jgi:hypothetical protein